jgi:hypothetical protein
MVELLPAIKWSILGNQVHPMVQMLFLMITFSKLTVCPYTQPDFLSWFEEHEDALQHLPWPAQLPDLNIVQPLWSV